MSHASKLKENIPGLAASLLIAAIFAGVAFWCGSGLAALSSDVQGFSPRGVRVTGRAFGTLGIFTFIAALISLAFLVISGWIFFDCFRAKPVEDKDADLRDPFAPTPPPKSRRRNN
jgi:hypothetical protein